MKKSKLLTMFGFVAIVTVASFMGQSTAYAANGGDSNDENVGGCSSHGTNCTSWGVTWVKQPLDEFLASANRVGLSQSQKDDMIAACAGMSDPYVYRLAYVDFANGGKIQLDSVSGLISNDRADRNNAVFIDPTSIPGGLTAAEAQRLFNYALSLGVDMEFNWDQLAIFAFDQGWIDCPDGSCLPDPNLPVPVTQSASAYFESTSTIDVGDGIPEGPQTTSVDGTLYIEYSTDNPSVTVRFSHTMYYKHGSFSMGADDAFTTSGTAGDEQAGSGIADVNDTENNHTNYTITTGGGGDFGVFTTSDGSQSNLGSTSQTVSLSPGETQTVCSYINYHRKFANMKAKKHITVHYQKDSDPNTPGDQTVNEESHMDWYNSGYSGSGMSGVCATITRPADPTGEPQNPNASGLTTSNIMFAGETTAVKWDINAVGIPVRRLTGRQITAHLIEARPGNESRFFTGRSRSGSAPYDYYSGSYIVERKNFGEEGASFSGDSDVDHYSRAFNVVVPDYTGYKYCHSGGYHFDSWYSINGNWKQDTRAGKSYWYVYNASCRTIAKKPSVAIWNGSMLTSGGVNTATATRYNSATFGTRAESGGSRTLYGSWAEYLDVIGKSDTGFASGASFAIGSGNLSAPRTSPFDSSNSSLTIANKDRLGSSEVQNNSTYRTRLTTFLENQAVRPGGDTLGAMSNVTDTQILRYDGNLKITGNITTAPGPYSSIYHVPQVVIFVHGNLEIASDVTRLDAWLIVDGKINTCSEFRTGETQADANNRLLDQYCTKQLVFNGPVMAGGLVLNRSFGSDPIVARRGVFNAPPTKYNAGEIFNFRMDSYLWAYAQAGRYASSYTESYTRELAPRY